MSVLVTDWLRLSVALLPLLAATCAPDALLLSVRICELLELSVVERSDASVHVDEAVLLLSLTELFVRELFELSVVDRFDASVCVLVLVAVLLLSFTELFVRYCALLELSVLTAVLVELLLESVL